MTQQLTRLTSVKLQSELVVIERYRFAAVHLCTIFPKNYVPKGLPFMSSPLLLAQMVKNLPAMQETWVQALDWEYSPGERNGYPL